MAPVVLAAIQTRHPTLTPDQYAHHYDNVHIPLLKRFVGDEFPVSHSRYYLRRGSGAPDFAPLVVMGADALDGQDVDSVAIVVFRDEDHYKRFNAKCAEEGVWSTIQEDMDRLWKNGVVRCVVVGEPSVTLG